MMSLEAIRSASDRATRRAAGQRRVPYVPYDQAEIDRMPPFPMPFMGDYAPQGWTAVGDAFMVDSSGFGADDEPALSVQRFKMKLTHDLDKGYGYAIVESGQFQVYVQAYKPPANYKARRHPA